LISPLFPPHRYEKEGCWKRVKGERERGGGELAFLFALVGKEMDITKNGL